MHLSHEMIKDHQVTNQVRWKVIQALTKMFWRCFEREHLAILQIRKKMKQRLTNMKKNDLSIFRGENIPR